MNTTLVALKVAAVLFVFQLAPFAILVFLEAASSVIERYARSKQGRR